MFEDGFNQMAYSVLVAKFPDLIQNVITFKVLDTDVSNGAGVGAFVMQHNDDIVYIPVVMADNQLKPLDMFYHKNLNVFLPLTNDWLDEVSQLTLDEMGETVTPPKTLRRDVDIRNLVIPPTTGRYAYAAAKVPFSEDQIPEDLLQMIQHTQEKTAAATQPVLLDFLRDAPNQVKVAFNNTLQQNRKLATQAVRLYGLDPLCDALKLARATSPTGGALYVVNQDTPESEFKEIFGDRAADAFQRVLREGYAYKEGRQGLDNAVQVQTRLELHTPSKSGFYRVFDKNGDIHHAFVLHNPRAITGHYTPERVPGGSRQSPHNMSKDYSVSGKRHDTLGFGEHNKDFIVVMNDGKWTRCKHLIGDLLNGGEDAQKSDCFGKLLMGDKGDTPTADSRGMFVQKTGQGFVGTEPFRIKSVSTDSKGVRRITTQDAGVTLVTDKTAARMGMHQPKGVNLMYIPVDARFIKLNDQEAYDTDLLRTPTEVSRWFYDRFEGLGARSFTVKNAGIGHASINGEPGMPPVQAMKEAAQRFNVHFSAAENLVKQAMEVEGKGVKAYVLTAGMNEKVAQTPMMDPSSQMMGGAPPPGGAPGAPGAPMDPSMQGMPPAAPPPPPSPLDIAMGEAQTQIQQQMADLEQQAMALQDKAQTLGMVQQRAQEMAVGGAPAVGMGAPPMPPPGGAPPPEVAGGMGGVPAPGAMGGMTGQEAMVPMGPGAMMATETPSASEIQNQVNPQFLEQAGALQDTNTFDAAAIGSIAQAPSFRDMVTDYVPTMERALDNMGRTLLTMWMQESELKEQIGDDEYVDLEDNLRAVFEGLGDLVLTMNRNATVLSRKEQGL
jgi:hypothetical protein